MTMRVAFLGKKGELTAVLKSMKEVDAKERPIIGQMVNETRAEIEKALEETKKRMEAAAREEKLKNEVIDVTLPAKKNNGDTGIPTPSPWKRYSGFSLAWATK